MIPQPLLPKPRPLIQSFAKLAKQHRASSFQAFRVKKKKQGWRCDVCVGGGWRVWGCRIVWGERWHVGGDRFDSRTLRLLLVLLTAPSSRDGNTLWAVEEFRPSPAQRWYLNHVSLSQKLKLSEQKGNISRISALGIIPVDGERGRSEFN